MSVSILCWSYGRFFSRTDLIDLNQSQSSGQSFLLSNLLPPIKPLRFILWSIHLIRWVLITRSRSLITTILIVAKPWALVRPVLVLPGSMPFVSVLMTMPIFLNVATTPMPILRRNVLIPEPSVPIPAAESSNVTVIHPLHLHPVALPPKSQLTNVWMMPARIMPNVTVPLITKKNNLGECGQYEQQIDTCSKDGTFKVCKTDLQITACE